VKLRFYDPGFYVFHEYTHLLHDIGQVHITVMLNLRDFTFPQFHVFPEFALHFSSPDYEHLLDFTFCS
jgi:hypothetical protein